MCGEKGERERETSEWLAAKSSPGRTSGMEWSLTGGLETGIHRPVGSIFSHWCHFAPISGDTSQCLGTTVLLGDKKCCLADHQLPASVRLCQSHHRNPLALGSGALQRLPCLLHPEWCEALLELELLTNVLDAAVCIQGTERVSGTASQGTRSE